MVIPS